jgi:Icc-related predicted phosphoesterase
MIRVAAVGDVHLAPQIAGRHRAGLTDIADHADVLLLAGDLTRHGTLEEAHVVAAEYRDLPVPVVAVLGNHDHHGDVPDEIVRVLTDAGITVLDGDATLLHIAGRRVGIAGAKGFGLGFAGRCGSEFGEPEMKAFTRHGRLSAVELSGALDEIADADVRIALTHYAPIDATLVGEPPEIWPFLGNYLLGEAIDAHGCALAVHGHAHAGTEKGITDGGVRVRNVAQPVIGAAYAVYLVEPSAHTEPPRAAEAEERRNRREIVQGFGGRAPVHTG